MNRFTLFIAAASLAANAIYADNSQPAPIIKKITSEQLSAISQSPTSTQPPADLGGNFSSWELLGTGNFNAELHLVDPAPVTVYWCTTDPLDKGVDSWYIDGVFENPIRIAGMPFIDYYNINNFDTGYTYKGKPIMVEELTKHYDIGVETMVYPDLGKIELAMLYYVDSPDNVDNVIGYGIETVRLDGDFKDYNVNMTVAGETTDGTSLKVDLTFADATNVKTSAFAMDLGYSVNDDDLSAWISDLRDDASIAPLAETGSVYLPLNTTGTYVVVTTFDTDKDNATDNYKVATYNFEAEWSDWGTAKYTDDYLSSYYTDFPVCTAEGIKVQRHATEQRYRMVNPYTTTDTWTSVWSRLQAVDPEVNSYMEINCVNPEHTYIVISPSDITDGDGVRLVMGSAAHYNIINGRPDEAITEKGYWGNTTYSDDKNIVSVSFPRMTLMMRQISSEYPLFAGMNDAFALVMTASDQAGINEIETSSAEQAPIYYDLQGRIVDKKPDPGIYIKHQGSNVEKVIIR